MKNQGGWLLALGRYVGRYIGMYTSLGTSALSFLFLDFFFFSCLCFATRYLPTYEYNR